MKTLLPLLALGTLGLCGCRSPCVSYGTRVIQDGTNTLANTLFSGADEALINALAPDGGTPVSCNVFYIWEGDTGKRILIDTGMGGKLQAELKDADISPDTITDILITHSHFDHVGGLLATNGAAAFPNATVHITQTELEFWREKNPGQAAAVERVYKTALITPDGKTSVVLPDLVAIDAPGHTPGHVVFLLYRRFLFAGDILHSDLFQFAHPEICASFDNDRDAAVASRKEILRLAAINEWIFHSCHVKRSGLVERDGDGFTLKK